MNSARFARSVSGSRKAWRSSAPCSARIRRIACSSRSNSSDMPAWPASVSNSRRSAGVKPDVAPRRSPSSITPTSRVSPGTGAMASSSVPSSSMNAASAGAGVGAPHGPRALVAHDGAQLVGQLVRGRLHRLRLAALAQRGPQRQVVRRAEQDDVGRAHVERLARPPEQVDQRGLDVRRPRQRPRHAVEELQRAVLRVLGQVRPVGEHEHRGRRQDEPPRVPVLRDQRRAREPDARVRQRDHEVRAEHPQRLHRRQRVLGQRDHRERQPRADERARRPRPRTSRSRRPARSRPAPAPSRGARAR